MELRFCFLVATLLAVCCHASHHVHHNIHKRGDNVPLLVANWCNEDIYPGLLTQAGSGPSTTGFHLAPGDNQTMYLSSNWQGRVWGRTNCSFSGGSSSSGSGQACTTGDCGGALNCEIAGQSPATLAEFTFEGSQSQTFYDISLVDGYNLPLAIVLLYNGNSQLEALQSSQTNPSCIGSVGDLAPQNFNPYSGGQQFLGTSSSDPLPFETEETSDTVSRWCPWDLQVQAPLGPGDGVYPYPDGNVKRPDFDPCLSACAKYNSDKYCCTGSYDGPTKCGPNYYSKKAKAVCPDAYSYAYDDQDSTFIVPQGGGFQVIFCPGGRSTNIIATKEGSTSGSSSSSSNYVLRIGWLVIDGRALKAALACAVTLVTVLST